MAKVRFKSPEFEFAVFDGREIGIFDQVSGQVVSGTAPGWLPAVQNLETLKMVEVEEGKFVEVEGDLFQGIDGKWKKVEPGSRVLYCGASETVAVISPLEFLRDYEPA